MCLQGPRGSPFNHGSMTSGKQNVISDALSLLIPLELHDSIAEKEILAVNILQYSSIEEKDRNELL